MAVQNVNYNYGNKRHTIHTEFTKGYISSVR